jgi:hypothetical protein
MSGTIQYAEQTLLIKTGSVRKWRGEYQVLPSGKVYARKLKVEGFSPFVDVICKLFIGYCFYYILSE